MFQQQPNRLGPAVIGQEAYDAQEAAAVQSHLGPGVLGDGSAASLSPILKNQLGSALDPSPEELAAAEAYKREVAGRAENERYEAEQAALAAEQKAIEDKALEEARFEAEVQKRLDARVAAQEAETRAIAEKAAAAKAAGKHK